MPNLLAMSFEGSLAPSFDLLCLRPGAEPPDGWGLGWYPEGEPSASVLKDPAPRQGSLRGELLQTGEHLASSVFVLHLREAAWGSITDANTQPFCRSHGRRDWLFAHAGSVARRLRYSPTIYEPVGSTDSELVFCELLDRFASRGWRSLADADPERLLADFREFDGYGGMTVALTDGRDLCAYTDRRCERPLYLWELKPPYPRLRFGDHAVEVDLGRRGLKSRKGLVLASEPLAGRDDDSRPLWQPVEPGRLVIARHGTVRAELGGVHGGMPISRELPGLAALVAAAPNPASAAPAPTVSSGEIPAVGSGVSPAVAALSSGEIRSLQAGARRVRRGTARPVRVPSRLLRVEHRTLYRYANPVERSVHLLRLFPAHDRLQRLVEHEIAVSVEGRARDYEDVFGNQVRRLWLDTPYRELEIAARAVVELLDCDPLGHHPLRARSTIPLAWMPWQRHMLQPYLLPPELPESELTELVEYAMSFVERNDYDLLDTLIDMNATIFEDYRYEQGSTNVLTTAFDVYVNRRGVCQDFANLFICLSRLLGVPARYVCGYLLTDPHPANPAQAEASHAWVQVYLPETGWRGFDPTNGVLTQTGHVRVAVGRSYVDATPTSGTIYVGGGGERLEVEVRVDSVVLDEG